MSANSVMSFENFEEQLKRRDREKRAKKKKLQEYAKSIEDEEVTISLAHLTPQERARLRWQTAYQMVK